MGDIFNSKLYKLELQVGQFFIAINLQGCISYGQDLASLNSLVPAQVTNQFEL